MLKTRIITAVIGVLIVAAAITWGGFFFNAIMVLLAIIGWSEYFKLIQKLRLRIYTLGGSIATVLVGIALFLGYYSGALFLGILSLLGMGIAYTFSEGRITFSSLQQTCGGLLYVLGGFVSLIILRDPTMVAHSSFYQEQPNFAVSIIWQLLICIWASDTFAYFAGRQWGQRRIVPSISPNKTLEGFVGGFIGCIVTSAIGAFLLGLPWMLGIGMGIIVGVMAPLGDLYESKLKREANVKDSGTLLPGHGGVLDRFDSLLFAAPLVLAYVFLF